MRLLRLIRRDMTIGFKPLRGATISLALMLILYVLVAGVSYNSIVRSLNILGRHVNYIEFLALGLASIAVAETSFLIGSLYWIDRRIGMLEQLIAGPFTRREYMASKIITAIIYSAVYTLLTALLVAPLTLTTAIEMLRAATAAPIASILFATIGLMLATTLRTAESYNLMVNIALIPLFLLSPAYYSLNAMPTPIRYVALLNPLTYVVEAMRSLMLVPAHALQPLTILAVVTAATTILAAARFKQIEISD